MSEMVIGRQQRTNFLQLQLSLTLQTLYFDEKFDVEILVDSFRLCACFHLRWLGVGLIPQNLGPWALVEKKTKNCCPFGDDNMLYNFYLIYVTIVVNSSFYLPHDLCYQQTIYLHIFIGFMNKYWKHDLDKCV